MAETIFFNEKAQAWWPNYDPKPAYNYANIQKGLKAIELLVEHSRLNLCIHANAHMGVRTLKIANYFKKTIAFEPDNILHECLEKNVITPNVLKFNTTLGDEHKTIYLRRGEALGSTRLNIKKTKAAVTQLKIDDLCLDDCSAIVLNGHSRELLALRGAVKTIEKFSPALLVEQYNPSIKLIEDFMINIKYVKKAIHGKEIVWIKRT